MDNIKEVKEVEVVDTESISQIDKSNNYDENQIEVKRLQLVQPKPGKPSNLMLIEGIVGAVPGGMKAELPLMVHKEDGGYTDEILRIYNIKRD